jgi:hypothetical protein
MKPHTYPASDPPAYDEHTVDGAYFKATSPMPHVQIIQNPIQCSIIAFGHCAKRARLCHDLEIISARRTAVCVDLIIRVSNMSAQDAYEAIETGKPQIPSAVNQAVREFLGPMSAVILERLNRSMRDALLVGATLESLRCHVRFPSS